MSNAETQATSEEPISEEIIDRLKAEHPDKELHLLGNAEGAAVFRVPTAELFSRYLEQVSQPEGRPQAMRAFVVGSVIYPEKAEFQKLLARKPGLVVTFANELGDIAGMKRATVSRKL